MVVSDIDGTLLANGVRPIYSTILFVNKQRNVTLITGRPEADRARTVMALKAAGVKYRKLLMNKGGDERLSKLKNAQSVPGITMILDNDAAMRAMYQRAGFNAVNPNVR